MTPAKALSAVLLGASLHLTFAAVPRQHLRKALHMPAGPMASSEDTPCLTKSLGLLEGQSAKAPGVYWDGYSRYGCEQDVSPKTQRLYFKDHVCGEVKSCRKLELGMTPRLCFDFCRAYANVKFFGIEHGRDCYCGTYIHAKSTGGGDCDLPCVGDSKEMCGGKMKSSVFEMHMCGDSASEASSALLMAQDVLSHTTQLDDLATETAESLLSLAGSWKLGICSLKPQGSRLCDLAAEWRGMAAKVNIAATVSNHEASVMEKRYDELEAAMAAASKKMTSTLASALEKATQVLVTQAAKTEGVAAATKLEINNVAGASQDKLKALASGQPWDEMDKVFGELGPKDGSFTTLCALAPLEGANYASVTTFEEPSLCADRCMARGSTQIDGCVGFNFVHSVIKGKKGISTCQLLGREGLVLPESGLNMAVPVFEVSKSKKDAMDASVLGCWVNKAFIAGHPKGPLKTEVIKEIANA